MRVLTLTLLLAVAASAQWTQFRGNPELTGVLPAGAVPKNLKLLWTYEAGESIESSAAISGGAVYVGSQAGDLIRVNLADGKLRWKYAAQNPIGESSPAIADGIVVVGDLAGVVHAVNAADGKKLWTYATAAEIKASPVIH